MSKKDVLPLTLLFSLILIQFSPVLFTGKIFFWGDMTYFFHAWHALPSEMLRRGQFPSWNPYSYMGMPLHGAFQTGTFTPATLPFYIWSFPRAYKLHLLGHLGLCAFLAYCCARRLGRSPAILAAALFSLNGFMISRVDSFNWTATTAWWPALFLFSGRPLLLALALAVSLAAGHPPLWAGMVAATLLLLLLKSRSREIWKSWAAALPLSLLLSACVLGPGLELIAHSNRQQGITLEERTAISLKPAALAGFISPVLSADPKAYYIGASAALLALLGLLSMGRAAMAPVLYLSLTLLLLLGNNNSLSGFIWKIFPPLHYLRSPAHYAFLPLAAFIPLAARTLRGKKWAAWACLACGLELLFYGRGLLPTVPQRYFSDAGPLVERLRAGLGGHRYAASPLAALLLQGYGKTDQERYFDLKHRLYGLGNVPYHLHAATGLGEAMLLAGPYSVMDFLFSLPGPAQALPYLPWIDAKLLLTKDPPPGLKSEKILWSLTEAAKPSRAWLVADKEAISLHGEFSEILKIQNALPLAYQQLREDRFGVRGEAKNPGWAFVSNAFYPGWLVYQSDALKEIRPAAKTFMAVRIEPGQIHLDFVYKPLSIPLGIWISLAALAGLSLLGIKSCNLV